MAILPEVLRIPDGPEKLLLPAPDLPISQLMELRLPPQRKSTTFADPSDYLSDQHPTVTTFDALEIPVPPAFVVKALGRAILSDPEIKSIMLVHSPTHRGKGDRYPPWLATIWSRMEPVREARTLWHTAVDHVRANLEKSTTTEVAADRARVALQVLEEFPWDGVIKGFKGDHSVSSLARWLTTEWLNTDHEDQMLELLAADLELGDGSMSTIQTTYFVHALTQVYSNPEMRKSLAMGMDSAAPYHRACVHISTANRPAFMWDPRIFSLAHWFDSQRFPLPNPTAAVMAEERMKMYVLATYKCDHRSNWARRETLEATRGTTSSPLRTRVRLHSLFTTISAKDQVQTTKRRSSPMTDPRMTIHR
ncbi:hypothetical protein B0H14DRAFT_2815810, partial [Mycena olivaceomarginata]